MDWFQDYWWVVLGVVLLVPLLAVALFARWLRAQPTSYDEKIKSWDVFVKLVSALTVITTGAILIGKYVDQREQADRLQAVRAGQEANLRTAEVLRQKLAFDTETQQRRRKLFDEVKVVAARIANSPQPKPADVTRFDELYYADLIGLEGADVEGAMVRFRRKFRKENEAPADPIGQLALQLAIACETELAASRDKLLDQYNAIAVLLAGSAKPAATDAAAAGSAPR